jgi:hypothetical protein
MQKLNYKKPPVKKALVVRFDDKYDQLIREHAKQDGKSRAEVVRTIVSGFYDQ